MGCFGLGGEQVGRDIDNKEGGDNKRLYRFSAIISKKSVKL